MERNEAGQIGGRHQSLARNKICVARKLTPKGTFQIEILTHGNRANIGKRCLHIGNGSIQRGQGHRADMHRQMVLTISCSAAGEVIFCTQKALAQGGGFVRRRAQPAQRKPDAFIRNLSVDESKAFRHRQLMRQTQQIIEHTRRCICRIILDGNNSAKTRRVGACAFQFEGIKAKADPLIGQILASVAGGFKHGLHFAIVQRRQYLQRFGTSAICVVIAAKQARAIAAEGGEQIGACRIQFAQFPRLVSQPFGAVACSIAPFGQAVKKTNLSLGWATNQHQHHVINIELFAAQLLLPRIVKVAHKTVGLRA